MNKQPAPKRPVSVLVLLHDGADHVLLLERIDRAGFWQSVTGSLENDETPVKPFLREIAEETGIVLDPSSLHDWQHCVEYEIFEHWRHRYPAGVTHNT
ncbi:dihydroneopterin triphosphate diphosphatase, partial [Kingella kingae]|uniref:dihydroneopterin triphosphate diphosphatase n=1 Tax=Kingella kingae TaxID=504 RepID=UPI001E2E079B